MKSKKRGYLLLEGIVSLFIIVTLSLSFYYILFFSNNYKNMIQNKVELHEQGEEISFQINKLLENSKGIISIRDTNGKTIFEDNKSYIKAESIKCRYRDEYNKTEKDREISFKRNNKLFINTLNSGGGSEAGGYEIGDYVDSINIINNNNKISIKLYLSKGSQKYETEFNSYIRMF